ncbi:MAG: CHAT domain-containing protein, partial [Anaerolineae bacterium]|nr:CHAT domain-containing protein [Anaerolineae bacterium]
MELILRFARLDRDLPFDAPVPVTVHFDSSDSETFDFRNPLADADLTDLRWYIERYPLWPVGPDYDRAEALQARLPRLGRALFDAVFDRSATAMRLWERFDGRRDGAEPATVVVDTTEPRILRLPWELLADEGGYLFSKQPPVHVRRRMHRSRDLRVRPFQPPVRLLVVVSRPAGTGFIDPRSSAAPLLDALDPLGDAVAVEFLRPPTLAALNARLRDPDAPPVHVVHFDGHGVYDPAVGLGFLLFEDDRQERHDVDAEQLGALLNECGIPLMVLDACQTAMPDERNPFASVAARLIESGVGAIVAMNYSVLVETAKRLTGHLYRGLAQGKAVSAALDDARLQLLADSKRLTLHRPGNVEETIHLQDWFVPALYSQEAVLRPFTPHPTLRSLPKGEGTSDRPPLPAGERGGVRGVPRQPARAGFPPEPQYGFHGRARELLALERAFAVKSIVVLHGFGGQGKTSLATHAAHWLMRTGLFQRAAFVSFESGAGLEVVLAELGNALVGDNFAIHEGDPVAAIDQALAEQPTLVVFDNVESILPNGDVPLPTDALHSLLNAAAQWFPPLSDHRSPFTVHPSSRLLVTTRDPNLPHPAFQPGRSARRVELPGLDTADALEFAGTVLQALSLP